MPKNIDVVYILKKNTDPQELIYSLRSLKNFPHRKVWFVGGQPDGLYPDGRIAHEQTGVTKWERVRSSLIKITECDEITDDFYLFNDDFFVMKPQSGEFVNLTDGTLEKKIKTINRKYIQSNYAHQLERLRAVLLFEGVDAMSFALHVPFKVNKEKTRALLKEHNTPMFRSLYGNIYNERYIYHKDVKINDVVTAPDEEADYLSTNANSFINGKAGEYIRAQFTEPCAYELTPTERIRRDTAELYEGCE